MTVYKRLAIVAFLAVSGPSLATEPTSTPTDPSDTTGTTTDTTGTTAGTTATTSQQGAAQQGQHQGQMNDGEIMGLLDALNRAEMEQARYVLSKSKNLDVKRYAQMTLDEHHEMVASNREVTSDMRNPQVNQPTPAGTAGAASGGLGTTGATGVGGSVGDAGTVDPGTNTGTTAGGANTTAGMDHTGTGAPATAQHQGQQGHASGADSAASQQLLDASEKQLAALKAASATELDRLYVQNVVQTHQKALDIVDGKMVAMAQSPEVKQQLMQLRPQLREHLEEAQQLQSNLSAKSKSGGSK